MSVDAATLRYFAQAAIHKGVPVDDAEDAAQDMWVRLRHMDDKQRGWKAAVAFAAIDAARRYGWTARSGRDRTTATLEHAFNLRESGDDFAAVDARLDMMSFLARHCTDRQREILLAPPGSGTRSFQSHRGQVRKRARKRWVELRAMIA